MPSPGPTTIDQREVAAVSGETILSAARREGIEIPTLCFHPRLSGGGHCRVCLVEVDGGEHLVPACQTVLAPGQRVVTHSPRVRLARKMVLGFLAANGDFADESSAGRSTDFARLLREYDIPAASGLRRYPADLDTNPFFQVDLNRCILCTRCVRACAEVQGRFVWGLSGRGHETQLTAGMGETLQEAGCEACGACVTYCPTGALSDRLLAAAPPVEARVQTTCGYCGVGCQFGLEIAAGRVAGVSAIPAAPVNGEHLCVKGRYGFDFIHHPDRLSQPQVRQWVLDGRPRAPQGDRGAWVTVDWDVALELVSRRLVELHRESGGAALGFFSSAKCTNEENYLVQKLARQVFGTHHVDHCARLCHASTVAGLNMALGTGAMSQTLRDVADEAAAIFVIGSNTTEQHPVFGAMLRQAVLRRKVPIVVADPRRIDLVDFAALHLRHRPGTDLALLNCLMHILLRDGRQAEEFIAARCENYDAWRDSLSSYTPSQAAEITGVSPEDLETAARILGESHPLAVVWAMGITQHVTGVMNVLALANLQLLLGNFGMPGGGVNPLRGQNNVQGACDMGALPNVFPGYQSVESAEVRAKFAAAWACTGPRVGADWPDKPGDSLTRMIDRAGTRDLRGLFILGENPVLTDPDSGHVRRSLAAAEFVVLQEIFPSATAEYADVLLPGTTFAERDGTFTNTERRVQLVRQAIGPQGGARPDWRIVAELGRRCLALQGRTPMGPWAGYDFNSPAEVFRELAAVTPSYAGISHARLQAGEQLHWPVPDAQSAGTPILHRERFPRGRGRFHVVEHLPPHELPDADYPLLLTTGRVLQHWHAGEMTHRSQGLHAAAPLPLVEISPADGERWGIRHGQPVHVASRRGRMQGVAQFTSRVAEGVIFANFHFPFPANANELTHTTLDPIAQIPEYKVSAVCISPGE